MVLNIKLKNTGIIADFDGTITNVDSNDLVCSTFGSYKNEIIEREIRQGKLTLKQGAVLNYRQVSLTEDEYNRFILENIKLRSGFKEFYARILSYNIPFAVVSGGFVNAIQLVFEREGLSGIKVYANTLIFNGNSNSIRFFNEDDKCFTGIGPCGNCKIENLRDFKTRCKKVIYIGDGITDRCVAHEADMVFARGELEEYCIKENISYIKYNDFYDISNEIFGGHHK